MVAWLRLVDQKKVSLMMKFVVIRVITQRRVVSFMASVTLFLLYILSDDFTGWLRCDLILEQRLGSLNERHDNKKDKTILIHRFKNKGITYLNILSVCLLIKTYQ